MKCSKCGKENKDTAKYCSGCGAPLEQPEHSGEEKKKASGKNKWFTGAVIVILIAVLIAVGMVLFQKKKEKEFQQLVVSADRYLEEMDYQKAEDSYREILKVDPSRKSAYTGIIQAYYYQGKEEEIEEVINDAEEHISDTEGFDEILYWQEVKRRIQTYLDFMAETEERIPRGGFQVKNRALQTFGLSFLKNVDLDGDGIDEMLVAYTDKMLEDQESQLEYTLEVWAYKEGKMEKVHTGELCKMNSDRAVVLEYMEDGTVQFVSTKAPDGLSTTYYAYKDGKVVPDIAIERKIQPSSVMVNGQGVTEEELENYTEKYKTANSKEYILHGHAASGFYSHEFDKTNLELEYQLRAVEGCYKCAIKKANGESIKEEGNIQNGNYMSVSDESGMYLNAYTGENQKKVLQIRYYYFNDIGMNFETVEFEYDKESGIYQEVADESSYILSIAQEGDSVSVLIKSRDSGYGMDAQLLRETQYDSVEAHKKYRKKFIARTLLTEEEATKESEAESHSKIELSKDEVMQRVVDHYRAILPLPTGDKGGIYTIYQYDVTETEKGYEMALRYDMGYEQMQEITDNGEIPQTHTIVGMISVNMETGEVSMENSDTWNLLED